MRSPCRQGKREWVWRWQLLIALTAVVLAFATASVVKGASAGEGITTEKVTPPPGERQTIYLCIAAMVSVASLSAAYAVGKVGAAAIGAASERPELLGRSLIFVGLAEGIAIYGLLMALLILGKV